MTPVLRSAAAPDLPSLLSIERASFSSQRWTSKDFLRYRTTVAEIDGRIAGFLVSRQIFAGDGSAPSEREILNVAVDPLFRRLGVATCLLQHELRSDAVHFLEVRESNAPARALYKLLGFVEVSRRSGYYRSPPETAIVMRSE